MLNKRLEVFFFLCSTAFEKTKGFSSYLMNHILRYIKGSSDQVLLLGWAVKLRSEKGNGQGRSICKCSKVKYETALNSKHETGSGTWFRSPLISVPFLPLDVYTLSSHQSSYRAHICCRQIRPRFLSLILSDPFIDSSETTGL